MRSTLAIVACLALAATSAVAQCAPGSTTLAANINSNNGQSGVMFDVTAATTLTICSFNVNFDPGSQTIAIYSLPAITDTGASYYFPNHTTAAPWTLEATLTVVSNGLNVATPLPLALNHTLTAGQRKAYYITATVGTGQNYVNGAAHNVVWATDGNLTIYTGAGKSLPLFSGLFGGTATASRNFSGSICYVLGAGGCPLPPPPPYDTNTAGSSLDINGLQGTQNQPALSVLCQGATTTVTISTNNAGQPFDLAYNLAPLVPLGGGGIALGSTGKVNLDLSAGINFLNGGPVPLLLPNPGTIALQFAMPVIPAPGLSAQVFQINPAHPDGFELSQPVNLQGLPSSLTTAGPVGDDVALSFTAGFGTAPSCFNAPTIALYGTTYTQYHVITNGRVVMGPTVNTSFTPAAVYTATDPAFAGGHADFNTAVGGTITVNNNAGALEVVYSGIGYFGQTGTASNFTIRVDSASNVTISNVTFGAPTASRQMFLGVHPGGAVAIEAGFPATFVGSGGFTSMAAGFSHGVFGDLFTAPLADAGDTLTFTYNGAGGYNVSY